MDKEINLYLHKDKVSFVLCGLEGSATTFFERIHTQELAHLEVDEVNSIIKELLSTKEIDFLSSRVKEPFSILGYGSFQELFKKTKLITVRIENSKLAIFKGKKVKRWYEFEPIDPVDGFDMDDESINKFSGKLLDVLRSPL